MCVLDRQINLDLIIKDKNNNGEKSWEVFDEKVKLRN